jgi:hypothetical protein
MGGSSSSSSSTSSSSVAKDQRVGVSEQGFVINLVEPNRGDNGSLALDLAFEQTDYGALALSSETSRQAIEAASRSAETLANAARDAAAAALAFGRDVNADALGFGSDALDLTATLAGRALDYSQGLADDSIGLAARSFDFVDTARREADERNTAAALDTVKWVAGAAAVAVAVAAFRKG